MGRFIAKLWFYSIHARVYLATRKPWCWVVGLPSMEEFEHSMKYTYKVYGFSV